jgi:hypothetical protein
MKILPTLQNLRLLTLKKTIAYFSTLIMKQMPKKGKAKNTVNKAKHTRLMHQKINKVKLEKQRTRERLKAIILKANEQKDQES